MLWNDPKKSAEGVTEPRRGQPQSGEEYARWCEHFPDPQAPSTHVVAYRWEPSPSPRAPRVLVFECAPKTEAGSPAEVKPEAPPANEDRRKELMAMDVAGLATAYGVASLGSYPRGISKTKAVAQILEAEAAKA